MSLDDIRRLRTESDLVQFKLPLEPGSGVQIVCAAGQKMQFGPHLGCEDKTCAVPQGACMVMITDWHCACEDDTYLSCL